MMSKLRYLVLAISMFVYMVCLVKQAEEKSSKEEITNAIASTVDEESLKNKDCVINNCDVSYFGLMDVEVLRNHELPHPTSLKFLQFSPISQPRKNPNLLDLTHYQSYSNILNQFTSQHHILTL